MNLVWKLLKENISKYQLIGFFITNLIGITIILLTLQFYLDINFFFKEKNQQYIVITKEVKLLDFMNVKSTIFTEEEIQEISAQNFVEDLGVFTSSRFNVYGGINQHGMEFSTEMFFETIPDKFIDVDISKNWSFKSEQEPIPVILPRNYLDLYNYGFAESHSLPKISEVVMQNIDLNLVIRGQDKTVDYIGKIVGFSNRINTILVPREFMDWANENYANKPPENPSRLIIKLKNLSDPKIAEFIKKYDYNVEGDNDMSSKLTHFLKMLIFIVFSIGVVICALSICILILSIYLILQKNIEKLENLRLIGYSRNQVSRPYEIIALSIGILIIIVALLLVDLIRKEYLKSLNEVWDNMSKSGSLYVQIVGIILFLFLSTFNIFMIRRKIK